MQLAKNLKQQWYWKRKEWRNGLKRLDMTQIVLLFILTLFSVFMLLPLIYLFNHAFKPLHELLLFPPTFIVRDPTTQNFLDLLNLSQNTFVPATRYLFNSIIVTVLATMGMVVVGALCAYPLSKHKFPGAKILFGLVLLSLLYATEVIAVPRYLVVQSLGIMNTYWGHVLPMIALPVGVFLMKQFMDQVPNEMLEAAKIDGASEIVIFYRIVIPLVGPAMATITIIAFQSAWGNTETSALFMQDDSMKTLPFYLSTLTSNLANSVARQGAAAAGALVMFVPLLVTFLVYQSKFIDTMAHTGIK